MMKKAMSSITASDPLGMALQALTNVWFWGGGIAGGVLLLSFLLTLRTLDLSVAYPIVTSCALVGITIASFLFLGEQASLSRVGGVLAIFSGVLLLAYSQGN